MDTTLSFVPMVGAQFAQLDVEPWHWGGLLALIAAMLAADLYLHRANHEPTTRHALIESAVWVAFGLGFSVVVLGLFGGQAFGEYLSGYVIEKSLSIDNVFVWAVIFSTFAIPARYQHRVLFWGIFGALALRGCSSSPAARSSTASGGCCSCSAWH